ncbi:MAG TPA: response regulator [Chloroflexota bacterium]|jgi:DNA-binding response OmpR family regulator|nr:response regulator [Chloroflexota bacterium]
MAQTVLVVDDDPDICEIVRVNLEGAGYDVVVAADGAAGLAAAREILPDLIILDVLLPELDGWQVLEELERDPTTAGRPVVMLTCKGDDQDVLRGLGLGAVEYLTKPFYPENLVASVRILLDVFDASMRDHRRQQLIARRRRLIERMASAAS